MYYLRTRAAADAIKFTVDQQALQRRKSERLAKASSGVELASKVCGVVWGGRWWGLPRDPAEWRRTSMLLVPQAPASPGLAPQQENRAGQGKKTAAEVDAELERERQMAAMVCSLENKEACLACGS